MSENIQVSHMAGNGAQGDDTFINKKFEQDAKKYEEKFGDLITDASALYNESYTKYDRKWGMNDTVALGAYLESWDQYSQMFESDPTTRDNMGDYLRVGLGLAAIQYATLPASFIASVQPLSDEVGMVYFRELIATATRGGVTEGDIIGNQSGKIDLTNLDNYYGESGSSTVVHTTKAAHAVALGADVRPRTVMITVTLGANTWRGIDDGGDSGSGLNNPSSTTGVIYGNWDHTGYANAGTINYVTGALVLNVFSETDGSIGVTWHNNLAQSATIPGFQYRLSAKQIRANYFILENVYSTLADYAVRRRFGKALSDDIASAAVAQINAAVLSAMIKRLSTAGTATGTVQWDGRPDAAVSLYDHRRTFPDALEGAAQLIDAQTMRGAINFIIAGSFGRRIFQSLGCEMVRKPLPGPYLTGFWQNIPVFYAPATLVANNKVIVGYRGSSWFEAPLVYAPFLPLVMVKGAGPNPFNRITGVAHAAGIDTVVTGFVANVQINNMS